MNERPTPAPGLRHVALNVQDLAACERFYVELLGMRVDWRPDADNVYLTGGGDNLALHRGGGKPSGRQSLDHIGFVVSRPEEVDGWHAWLAAQDVAIVKPPKTHRDGARSFYCRDPDGNVVQIIAFAKT
jgi:catechol 2,3-dioxygenase-like lactoylglutathione lyase family enzyme